MLYLIKKIYSKKAQIKAIESCYLRQKKNNYGNMHFYNWWQVEEYKSLWLYRFVQNTGLLDGTDKQLNFCSLFEMRKVLDYVNDGVKIFFSGENLHLSNFSQYADALLGDNECQLSIGFDYFEDKRYLRFPLWITYIFDPILDEDLIKQRCEQLCYSQFVCRKNFACLIARSDLLGVRTDMYDRISKIGRVDCPSGLLHNDDSLHLQYGDDKIAYMRNYQFNICPENSNAYGYCTEKIFEAILAGCIPIYWGCYNMPEPKILNPTSIIFWNRENGGVDAIEQIQELYSNPRSIELFLKQPRLLPNAHKEVVYMMNQLYERLKVLILCK